MAQLRAGPSHIVSEPAMINLVLELKRMNEQYGKQNKISIIIDEYLARTKQILDTHREKLNELLDGYHAPKHVKDFLQKCRPLLATYAKLARFKAKMREQYAMHRLFVPLVMPHTVFTDGTEIFRHVRNMALLFLTQFTRYPNPKNQQLVIASINDIAISVSRKRVPTFISSERMLYIMHLYQS